LFKIRAGTIVGKDTFWLNRAIDEEEGSINGVFPEALLS
jgi:hypothetical protein